MIMIDGGEDVGLDKEAFDELLVVLVETLLSFVEQGYNLLRLTNQLVIGNDTIVHNLLIRGFLKNQLIDVDNSLLVEKHDWEGLRGLRV